MRVLYFPPCTKIIIIIKYIFNYFFCLSRVPCRLEIRNEREKSLHQFPSREILFLGHNESHRIKKTWLKLKRSIWGNEWQQFNWRKNNTRHCHFLSLVKYLEISVVNSWHPLFFLDWVLFFVSFFKMCSLQRYSTGLLNALSCHTHS